MGCVGMSMQDFDRCTPFEFSEIVTAWHRLHESRMHQSWEQTRFLITGIMQPFCKDRLNPRDVMVFDWDEKKPPKAVAKSTRERMEEIKRRLDHQNQGT